MSEAGAARRAVLVASLGFILTACNAGSVMEPTPRVDVGIQTAAVPPPQAAPVYEAPVAPVQSQQDFSYPDQIQDAGEYAETAPLAADPSPQSPEGFEALTEPAMQPAPMVQAPSFQPPPVVEGPRIVETPAEQPMVVASAAGMAPSRSVMTGYPRADPPMSRGPGMPAGEVACRQELRKLGVQYRDIAPINDGGACRIDYPVKVSMLPQRVNLKPAATLTCAMALTVARWTRNELVPAARTRYLSSVRTIHQGSSYSCRNIRTSRNRTPSEHSRGNALDIMRIELNSGRDIDVRRPGFFAFREKGLLNTVRSDACRYFSTVLGPGYDRDHADHFHFDIKSRRNGYVACR